MVINQARSRRMPSGARYKEQKVRRKHESGGQASLTKLDAVERKRVVRTPGGNHKTKLLAGNVISILDQKSGKHQKATVLNIKENPANRHFVRRNIMTKGCVVETSAGDARITNRPGQSGHLQAVLL